MKKKNLVLLIILAILVVVFLFVLLPFGKAIEETAKEETVSFETESNSRLQINLGSGLYITSVDPYVGGYVEDGTDEFVENIIMLTIENRGENNIQLATITLNDAYTFEFTTLLPGKKLIALEKNRAQYEKDMVITFAEISNVAFFDKNPSMHEELLEISGDDGMIAIENISGENFHGGKVFYKNVVDSCYLGGITYFGRIPELESGEGVKISAKHYLKDSSEFVFVTYAE